MPNWFKSDQQIIDMLLAFIAMQERSLQRLFISKSNISSDNLAALLKVLEQSAGTFVELGLSETRIEQDSCEGLI